MGRVPGIQVVSLVDANGECWETIPCEGRAPFLSVNLGKHSPSLSIRKEGSKLIITRADNRYLELKVNGVVIRVDAPEFEIK